MRTSNHTKKAQKKLTPYMAPYTAPYMEIFLSSVYGAIYGATPSPYMAPYTELRILASVYGAIYGVFTPYTEGQIRRSNTAPYTELLTPYMAPYTEGQIRRLRIRRAFRRQMQYAGHSYDAYLFINNKNRKEYQMEKICLRRKTINTHV